MHFLASRSFGRAALGLVASSVLAFGVALGCSPAAKTGDEGETGGTGGTSSGSGAFGESCKNGCESGLFCFDETRAFFGSGGPPGGLCTKACETTADCGGDGLCVRTEKEGTCVPSCAFGDDADKCGGRKELSCAPVLAKTGAPCQKDDDCEGDARCYESATKDATEGECRTLEAACLPRCAGDFDCEKGFCNLGSGECEDAIRKGLPRGSSCDPKLDECLGTCVETSGGNGVCEERCRIGEERGCGVETAKDGDVVCGFFAFDVGVEQGAGDTGVCASLCNCNSDCEKEEFCLNNPLREFAGLCAVGIAEDDSVRCDGNGGAGGMGGSP